MKKKRFKRVRHINKPWPNIWPFFRLFRFLMPPVWLIFVLVIGYAGYEYGTPHYRIQYGKYFGLNGIVYNTESQKKIEWFPFKDYLRLRLSNKSRGRSYDTR